MPRSKTPSSAAKAMPKAARSPAPASTDPVAVARAAAAAERDARVKEATQKLRAVSKTPDGRRRSMAEALAVSDKAAKTVRARRPSVSKPAPATSDSPVEILDDELAAPAPAAVPAAVAAPASAAKPKAKKAKRAVPFVDRVTRIVFLGLAISVGLLIVSLFVNKASSAVGLTRPDTILSLPQKIMGRFLPAPSKAGPVALLQQGSTAPATDARTAIATLIRSSVLLPVTALLQLVSYTMGSTVAETYGFTLELGFIVGAVVAAVVDL